jgi:hypothetical protein
MKEIRGGGDRVAGVCIRGMEKDNQVMHGPAQNGVGRLLSTFNAP